MSGPPPTPTALKVLRGNPGKRRLNGQEPKPPLSSRTPPAWLRGDPLALAIWRTEAPRQVRLGVLTELDRLTFSLLCERAAVHRRAALALRDGLTYLAAQGEIPKPEVGIARGALHELLALAREFGMTPAARSRLRMEPSDADRDELTAFRQTHPRART